MSENEPLIGQHGGYRRLKSFQVAQSVYDVTVRFYDRFIERRSRTHDRMVQAARSGVKNFELKPTSVARASLEELPEELNRARSEHATWHARTPSVPV
jgi:hypothetical protein